MLISRHRWKKNNLFSRALLLVTLPVCSSSVHKRWTGQRLLRPFGYYNEEGSNWQSWKRYFDIYLLKWLVWWRINNHTALLHLCLLKISVFRWQPWRMAEEGRTVCVHGLPTDVDHERLRDKLLIHFLRQRNGGGEVTSVTIIARTPLRALVSFEESTGIYMTDDCC